MGVVGKWFPPCGSGGHCWLTVVVLSPYGGTGCWDAVLCHKLFRTYVSRKATDKGRVVREVRCGVLGEALLECSGIMREPCQSGAGCNYQ